MLATSLRLLPLRNFFLPQALAAITAVCLLPEASAVTITNLQITASIPSPQPLGTPVVFQASAKGTQASLDYQYSVQGPLDSTFHIVRDFRSLGSLRWAPIDAEGVYQIRVIARNEPTGIQAQTIISYTLTSRVTGNQPVVNATSNPLVLLYSAPACPLGSFIQVRFALANAAWAATSQNLVLTA